MKIANFIMGKDGSKGIGKNWENPSFSGEVGGGYMYVYVTPKSISQSKGGSEMISGR